MDDGKSIRYKDLYALFEQILEKSMRVEQRDWSESPVKVWVNTFKVFLDEFMTEYKPMEGTIGRVRMLKNYNNLPSWQIMAFFTNEKDKTKRMLRFKLYFFAMKDKNCIYSSVVFLCIQAPKRERKKSRKKETDIVSHHYQCMYTVS